MERKLLEHCKLRLSTNLFTPNILPVLNAHVLFVSNFSSKLGYLPTYVNAILPEHRNVLEM